MAERTEVSIPELSRRLGLAEGPVKGGVRGKRERYRGLLREEVADTLDEAESID